LQGDNGEARCDEQTENGLAYAIGRECENHAGRSRRVAKKRRIEAGRIEARRCPVTSHFYTGASGVREIGAAGPAVRVIRKELQSVNGMGHERIRRCGVALDDGE
jgi:hypothetical protein